MVGIATSFLALRKGGRSELLGGSGKELGVDRYKGVGVELCGSLSGKIDHLHDEAVSHLHQPIISALFAFDVLEATFADCVLLLSC